MTYGGSIGHVTDDVAWPRKVKFETQIYYIFGNGTSVWNQMVTWPIWHHVTQKGQGRDPDIKLGWKYLKNGW